MSTGFDISRNAHVCEGLDPSMQHSRVSFPSILYLTSAPNPFATPFLPMLLRTTIMSGADEATMATIFVYLAGVMKEMGQNVTSSTLLRRRSPISSMNILEQRPFLAQVSPGGTCWAEHAPLTSISRCLTRLASS